MKDLAQAATFTDADKDRFQALIKSFLAGKCFVRRRKGDTEDDWRFVQRHFGIFAAYFMAAGWDFEIREDLGAAAAIPALRKHAMLFSPLQTHMVYVFAQAHYQATSGSDLDAMDATTLTFGELMERMESTLPKGTEIRRQSIEKAWKKLASFGAIELSRDFKGEPADVITVLPVIEMVLPRRIIEEQFLGLKSVEERRELLRTALPDDPDDEDDDSDEDEYDA